MNKMYALSKMDEYINQMKADELSENTVKKYSYDVKQWLGLQVNNIDIVAMLKYKQYLTGRYSAASINSKLISVNRYLKWLGCDELVLKTKRLQNRTSIENIITKEEYNRMLEYALKKSHLKMYHIMRTIARTGIRVGEMKYITVEALSRSL